MFVNLLLLSLACLAIQGAFGHYNDGYYHDSSRDDSRGQYVCYYNYYGHYWVCGYQRPTNYRTTTRRPWVPRTTTTRTPWVPRTTTTRPTEPVPVITTTRKTNNPSDSVCECTRRFRRSDDIDRNMTDSFRIVGGAPTQPHAYPQMVLIIYGGSQMCGGTILNEKYILTAAHCVQGNTDVSKYEVTVGAYDLNEREPNRKTVSVAKVIPHTEFNTRNFQNDIALLELKEPLDLNADVKTACLALDDTSYAGDEGTAVGWGRTEETGSASRILREVTVPILTNARCGTYYRGLYTIYATMICGGEEAGGKDSCAGDSGGPLFTDNKQVGVTSFGLGCARRERPGVYTRVTKYIDWIKDNVDSDTTCKIYSDDKAK